MTAFAHIINPVRVDSSSDLFAAQPITFATMRTAQNFAAQHGVRVDLFTAQYPEDRSLIPDDFTPTENLNRSVLDISNFKIKRKLPLIQDILDRLYQNSKANYLIYTNVDIALQPFFYWFLSKIAEKGYDAFIINRRTIPDTYTKPDETSFMYSEIGETHKGWDCFVFKRDLYPKFNLGTGCVGIDWIGRILLTNVSTLAKRFKIFTDQCLTFHIGNEKSWKSNKYLDYVNHNRNECKKILLHFEKEFGKLNRNKMPGTFFNLIEKII